MKAAASGLNAHMAKATVCAADRKVCHKPDNKGVTKVSQHPCYLETMPNQFVDHPYSFLRITTLFLHSGNMTLPSLTSET